MVEWRGMAVNFEAVLEGKSEDGRQVRVIGLATYGLPAGRVILSIRSGTNDVLETCEVKVGQLGALRAFLDLISAQPVPGGERRKGERVDE